jgi:hypothetical protein
MTGFQGLDERRYLAMLDRIGGLPGCKFVTVPDVVGDAAATLQLWQRWHSEVRRRTGQPVALVAQDGIEHTRVPWSQVDALFIGGSNDFKLGPTARLYAQKARRRGLWVHWGRVNTQGRINYISSTGAASSFDGSSFARFRKVLLDRGLQWAWEVSA